MTVILLVRLLNLPVIQVLRDSMALTSGKFTYNNNNEKIAATERYFEKIIETMLDIAFLIIKRKKYTIPEDDFNAFEILYENKIIDAFHCYSSLNTSNLLVDFYGGGRASEIIISKLFE